MHKYTNTKLNKGIVMVERIKIDTEDLFNRLAQKALLDNSLKDYKFHNVIFTIELKLEKANNIHFINCIFKEKVTFPNIISKDSSFADSTFEKEAIFSNSSFNDNVRFYSTKFNGKTDFNNTKFKKLADFWNATFKENVIFYKTDFLGTTVFSSTLFEKNVLFTYALISKLIIFRGTEFKKGVDLSLAIISGELSVFDVKLNIYKFDDLNDTDNVSRFEENVSETGVITRKNKRETFRIIKNHLNENQNSIDALEFFKFEMHSFTKQLEQKVYREKKINEIQNLTLLYLNALSSKHGTSWCRGAGFTFGVGLFFFCISILSTENYFLSINNLTYNDSVECVKYFFHFMLPTHSIDYLDSERPSVFFYLWDFLGRIFVSYGIYQTIQAFRKYKNK